MEKIKNFLGDVWNWATKNYFGFVVGLVIFIYLTLSGQAIKLENANESARMVCASMCFPQQSEYVSKLQAESCWCYIDSETMKRIGE
jgi:hypothetical protein